MNPELIERSGQIQQADPGVAASMAGAHLDTLIRVANEYPRDPIRCRDMAIQMATMDPTTSAGCVYALPRGGKTIEGPSIRLAEIVARSYRNLWVQTTPIAEDSRFVTVRTVAWDVEANLCIAADVRRRITDRDGRRFNDDMIGVTTAAAGSIAYRNAIFRVVPGLIWQPALAAATDVIRGDVSTLCQRRDACIAYFTGIGVDVLRVCSALGVDGVERIGMDELVTLRAIANAIKDEGVSPDEFFPAVTSDGVEVATGGSRTEAIKAKLAKQREVGKGGHKREDQASAGGAESDGQAAQNLADDAKHPEEQASSGGAKPAPRRGKAAAAAADVVADAAPVTSDEIDAALGVSDEELPN